MKEKGTRSQNRALKGIGIADVRVCLGSQGKNSSGNPRLAAGLCIAPSATRGNTASGMQQAMSPLSVSEW